MWRAATPADDEPIVRLCGALYDEDPAGARVPPEHMHRTLAALRDDPWRGRVLVLDLDGAPCGYALVCAIWSNEHGGEVQVIDELYVVAARRGAGHATRLFEELAVAVAGDGAVGLALEITPGNARARQLYERLGFRPGNQLMRRRIP